MIIMVALIITQYNEVIKLKKRRGKRRETDVGLVEGLSNEGHAAFENRFTVWQES